MVGKVCAGAAKGSLKRLNVRFRLPFMLRTSAQQFIRNFLQQRHALRRHFAALRRCFQRAIGLGAMGAIVETALPNQVAQIGEIIQ